MTKEVSRMYYICYDTEATGATYEIVSGEDAMQERVNEIMAQYGLQSDDIAVFDADDAI